MKEFEEYLKRIGKSENTALTYCRNIRMYFSWCRDSFGSEPKELYRSNVLEYISYMRNIRGYSPKSVNNHLSALRCLNKYLVQIGRQSDMAVLDSDFMKVQIQYASPCSVDKKRGRGVSAEDVGKRKQTGLCNRDLTGLCRSAPQRVCQSETRSGRSHCKGDPRHRQG